MLKKHLANARCFLVDSPRDFWNCTFSDLELLSERLEQLGVDEAMESDNV